MNRTRQLPPPLPTTDPTDPEPPVSANSAEWLAWRHRELRRAPLEI